MPRFSKKRMRTRRRGRTRRSRRGGEGERNAITDNSSALEDAAFARGLTPQSIGPEEEKLKKVNWPKYQEKLNNNPLNSDNQYMMKAFEGVVKGGKTKRKMRKHRK